MQRLKINIPDLSKQIDGDGEQPTKPITLNLEMKRSKKLLIQKEIEFDVSDFKQYDKLDDDEVLLDALWIICCDQCQSLEINEDIFKDSIFGEELESSRKLFVLCVSDFSRPEMRSVFSSIIEIHEKRTEAVRNSTKQLSEKLPKVMEKLESKTDQLLEEHISGI